MTPAAAVQPNDRACLGEGVRQYAHEGSLFGAFDSAVLADDGAGTEIHVHLAGLVPEVTIANTCND